MAGNAKYYERVQDCARSLYNILKQTFTWPCGCSVPHKASLRLQTRQQDNKSGWPLDISFNVLFSFETSHDKIDSLPWNWRETKIESLEHIDHEKDLSLAKLSEKRVMFAPTDVSEIAQRMKKLPMRSNTIDCLCKAMNSHIQNETCLGVLVDELQRQHRITVQDRSYRDKCAHTMSLESLLNVPTRLEKRDRLALGVKLASVSTSRDLLR